MNPSVRNLLLSNAATLAAALFFHWNLGWLLWPYLMQSVAVGWYARKRMLTLANFSTAGFTSNDKPVPENEAGKRSTAAFFALHFGAFHLGYLVFLCAMYPPENLRDGLALAACGASFALSQRATYAQQHAADLRGRPNLGALMFTPYLRIVPMHITIILGSLMGGGAGAVLLFVGLKTASDVLLDWLDRRMAAKSADKAAASAANA